MMELKLSKINKGDKIIMERQNNLLVEQMKRVTERSNKIVQDLNDSLNEVKLRMKLPHLKEAEVAELKRIEQALYEQISLLINQ